jgi:exosortase/archaeosortase family protein
MIVALSPKHFGNTFWAELMPLSVEYLVFAVLFTLIVVLAYGIAGLKNLAIATAFLGAIGTIYIIDNLYPEGQFTPFQIIVPTTTTLASSFLNLIGYRTYIDAKTTTPLLVASNAKGTFGARIAWPCSGVESLVIYAITILLFLKNSSIKWPYKIVYFLIGAIVTYFINILRIATIFVIAIDTGGWSYQAQRFHDYYGMLYSIIWILSYPLIIIGSRALWGRIRGNKARQDGNLPTYASSST